MPPKRLKLGEVPAYVLTKHGSKVSRATVYNWVKLGVRGTKLRTTSVKRALDLVQVTTTEWVDEFISTNSVRGA